MACLYPEHWIGERVAQVLVKHEVPIDMAKNNRNRVSTKQVAVRLLSMHTAKGLEFPCVAIAGLGLLGRHTHRRHSAAEFAVMHRCGSSDDMIGCDLR